ncbi:MAG: hypothetical protein QOF77_844 [Solirubrobacteraceae bacterium]|jgi:hypothetical protein|nr:hypothetical protein [Solirubrobacteraceae bacterium]
MLESFSLETFAELADRDFRLRRGDGEVLPLSLSEASQVGQAPPGGRASFSLLFRGPPAPILPQRVYALEHAELGAFELFLVPLEPDGDGARYEAVFG